jgi:guanylate kinase
MDTTHIFIISGPAGSGKDSIIECLGKNLPLERFITTTTRAKRPGESEGNPYYFVSQKTFDSSIQQGAFIEHSINENGASYGISATELHRVTQKKDCFGIWQTDWKGVQSIKKIFPGIPAIFISAPLNILEERIRSRDTTKDESYFLERMSYTKEWLKYIDIYDYVVTNEQGKLSQAVADVEQILRNHTEVSSL